MLLRLTNGTTTVNLTGGPIYLREWYVPAAPEQSEIEAVAASLADGGELVEVTRRNVVESVALTLTGADAAAVQFLQNSIERLFSEAEHYQRTGFGNRVWVEYRPGDSGDVYRSEILRGRAVPLPASPGQWAETALAVDLAWKRRCYWEGPEVELPLSNGHGSGTGGRTVYNCNDATRDNWVAIAGADVGGVIPAPVRLELQNTYNVTARTQNVYVGLNAYASPGDFLPILEGEDAAYCAGGSPPAAASSASGGYYQPVSWTGDNQLYVLRWELSTSMLSACAGGHFRILARFHSAPSSGLRLTPKVTFPSGTPLTVVGESQELTLATSPTLQSLGVLQLPPWLPGETSLIGVDLTLYARRTGGGSFNLDFIQITPLDGYQALRPRGYGIPYAYTLVSDGMRDTVYVKAGSLKAGYYLATRPHMQLHPGRDQRLYVLCTHNTGGSEIARTHILRAYYRPRRLTL